MKGKHTGFFSMYNRRGDASVFSIIKQGLVLALPFIMVGSLALVLRNFPLPAYQEWLQGFIDGKFNDALLIIFNSTMGVLSLVLLLTIAYSYGRARDRERAFIYPVLAVCAYLTFISWDEIESPTDVFGHSWIFTAIVIAMLSSALFRLILSRGGRLVRQYTVGADTDFNMVLGMVIPAVIVVAVFTAAHLALTAIFGSVSLQQAGAQAMAALFGGLGANLGSALLLVLFIQVFWFFGLHGSNMVDVAATNVFEAGMQANIDAVAAGQAPTEIFTKTFLDTFVFMGGSGTAIALVIAMLLVARANHNRKLAKLGLATTIFNINEIVLFGFPIIFNPMMLVPFLLVPVVLTLTSSVAVMTGLVPVASSTVQWTSPPIIGGYAATGSVAGSILQAVNIVIGVLIYIPFVKLSEKKQTQTLKNDVQELTRITQNEEIRGKTSLLLEDHDTLTPVARMLALDLRHAVEHYGDGREGMNIFYQPQVRYDGSIYGAEALLRWNHPVAGFIYPPLLIRLAQEDGYLENLDMWILDQTCRTAERLARQFAGPMEISVNLLPSRLEEEGAYEKIRDIYRKYDLKDFVIAIEITEQNALSMTPEMMAAMDKIKALGIRFAMDDFGMGHSSMMYLQNNKLDVVKLDGSLVQQLMENERAEGIIGSVYNLTSRMGVDLLAEHVETVAERERLHELGCDIYQGWLYSKAVPYEELAGFLRRSGTPERTE